jgi:hypothetical protein
MFHGDGSPKIAIGSMIRSNPVNLASAANVNAIFGDGSTVTNGGIDTYGNAFSASRLGTSVTSGGLIFTFQGAGAPNAVSSATVALPAGRFSTLNFLATAVRGNQTNQTFTVTYTDGTTSTGVQSFSDWYTPQNYTGETVALPMSSRLLSDGAPDNRLFNLYGYSLPVNPAKTVQSVTLPNNRNVVVLAVTLAR